GSPLASDPEPWGAVGGATVPAVPATEAVATTASTPDPDAGAVVDDGPWTTSWTTTAAPPVTVGPVTDEDAGDDPTTTTTTMPPSDPGEADGDATAAPPEPQQQVPPEPQQQVPPEPDMNLDMICSFEIMAVSSELRQACVESCSLGQCCADGSCPTGLHLVPGPRRAVRQVQVM
ncbi:hypothetical protein THAOC_37876, partial [Thalassiosira oceanica]